jgi:DNA-binding LacI/PurR family transcriptional regulator
MARMGEQTLKSSRRATWQEVAQIAGVSQSAVSRTFTPGASVSKKTRAAVEAAAALVGYRPTVLSRILQNGRSSIIAIVVGGLYNPFFTKALDLLAARLAQFGNQTMLVLAESDRSLDEIVNDLARYRVDAVISALPVATAETAIRLNSFRIPIVSLNSGHTGEWLRSVSSDSRSGGAQAAQALRRHKRLCYFAGYDSNAQNEREAGFVDECVALGKKPQTVICGYTYEEGRRAVAAYLASNRKLFDAVFCVNDLVACGVVDAIRYDLSLRVPEDVSIIGYDNIEMSTWAPYELTTFDQNMSLLVDRVMDMLSDQVALPSLLLPPSMVVRQSARLARAAAA